MAVQKKITLAVVVLVVLLGAFYALNKVGVLGKNEIDPAAFDAALNATSSAPAPQETEAEIKILDDLAIAPHTTKSEKKPDDVINATAIGDSAAPVIIREFSSYSCSHCGEYHRKTMGKIKRDYLNTKKAFLLFSDFPLNGPALQASVIASCVAPEKFLSFSAMLFSTQDQWISSDNYLDYLKQNAKLTGLDDAAVTACIEDEAKKKAFLANMEVIQAEFEISSTPSFIIYRADAPEDKTIISGAQPYEVFQQAIDKYLAPASAPTDAEAAPVAP